MAIQSSTFSRQFGAINRNQRNDQDFEKAKFWLNIGYATEAMNTETNQVEVRFISLAKGVPLDTLETFPTTSKNEVFAKMRGAQNKLRDDLLAAALELCPNPGDEAILPGEVGGLQLQIRHANAEQAKSTSEENPFVRELKLVG